MAFKIPKKWRRICRTRGYPVEFMDDWEFRKACEFWLEHGEWPPEGAKVAVTFAPEPEWRYIDDLRRVLGSFAATPEEHQRVRDRASVAKPPFTAEQLDAMPDGTRLRFRDDPTRPLRTKKGEHWIVLDHDFDPLPSSYMAKHLVEVV